MSGIRTSQMPEATDVASTDLMHIAQGLGSRTSRRTTMGMLRDFAQQIPASGPTQVARSIPSKLADSPSERDYAGSTQTQRVAAAMTALSEAGGGVLTIPAGVQDFAFQMPPTNVLLDIDGPSLTRSQVGIPGPVRYRKALMGKMAGPHVGERHAMWNVTAFAEGGGGTGTPNGDVAAEFRIDKENWNDAALAKPGEMSVAFFMGRQGGPTDGEKSSLGGVIVDVASLSGSGFQCAYEMASSIFDRNNPSTVLHSINVKAGLLDGRTGDRYGHLLTATAGTMDAAISIVTSASTDADWGRIIQNVHKSDMNFWITTLGDIVWNPLVTPTYRTKLANSTGAMEIRNGSDALLVGVGQDRWLLSPATEWTSGETVQVNDVRHFPAGTYRCRIGGVSTVAPTHTSGTTATGDGLSWTFERSDASAPFAQPANGAMRVRTLRVLSADASPYEAILATVTGTPEAVLSASPGSIALRPDGGASRSAYLKETGTGSSGWNAIITASLNTGVAAAGSTQGTATPITARFTEVSSVPNASTDNGVILAANFRDEQIIVNQGGAALKVYPPVGAQIDVLGTNNPFSIAAGGKARFMFARSTQFYTV